LVQFVISCAGLLLAALALSGCAIRPPNQGWITPLENGGGVDNFIPVGSANWHHEGGALVSNKGGKLASYLVGSDSYTDFMLYAEFWKSDDANSGIHVRLSDRQKITPTHSNEVNIFDKRPDPSYGTGAIVKFAKIAPMPKAGGVWNTFEFTDKGPLLTVEVNGVQTAHVSDRSFSHGPIALQYGKGVAKFRTVRMRPL
jgi:hypothetical protein